MPASSILSSTWSHLLHYWRDSRQNMGHSLLWHYSWVVGSFGSQLPAGQLLIWKSSSFHYSGIIVYFYRARGSTHEHYCSRVKVWFLRFKSHEVCTDQSCSIWVFTLLAMEAIKTYKSNPFFMLGTNKIPTWTTPLVLVLFVSFLVPNTSFLGHVCGLAFGYGCMNSSLSFHISG